MNNFYLSLVSPASLPLADDLGLVLFNDDLDQSVFRHDRVVLRVGLNRVLNKHFYMPTVRHLHDVKLRERMSGVDELA